MLGVNEMHSELEDTKKFEDMVHDKIHELQPKLSYYIPGLDPYACETYALMNVYVDRKRKLTWQT
jgi:hypothetical protein